MAPNVDPAGFYHDPFGWIGHNWLGGAQQQQADGQQDQIQGLLQQLSQQRNPYQDQANPYDQGNAGLMNLLALQQGGISRQFADTEQDTLRSLAQRGALGTAQETSALRQLSMDRARALSGNEASLRANTYDKGVGFGQESLANQSNWDTGRRNTMLGGLTGQRDYYQQQADAPKQALSSLAGLAAKAGTAYATGGGSLAVPGGGFGGDAAANPYASAGWNAPMAPAQYAGPTPTGAPVSPISGTSGGLGMMKLANNTLGNPYPRRKPLFGGLY